MDATTMLRRSKTPTPLLEHLMALMITTACVHASKLVADTLNLFPDFKHLCTAVLSMIAKESTHIFVKTFEFNGPESIQRMMDNDQNTMILGLRNIAFLCKMHTVLIEKFESWKPTATQEDDIDMYLQFFDAVKKINNASRMLVGYWGFSCDEL